MDSYWFCFYVILLLLPLHNTLLTVDATMEERDEKRNCHLAVSTGSTEDFNCVHKLRISDVLPQWEEAGVRQQNQITS